MAWENLDPPGLSLHLEKGDSNIYNGEQFARLNELMLAKFLV